MEKLKGQMEVAGEMMEEAIQKDERWHMRTLKAVAMEEDERRDLYIIALSQLFPNILCPK